MDTIVLGMKLPHGLLGWKGWCSYWLCLKNGIPSNGNLNTENIEKSWCLGKILINTYSDTMDMMANDGAWSVKHWPWLIHKSMTRLFMIPLPIIGSWYIVGYDWWILDKDGGQIEMIVSGKCATRFSTEVSAQSRPATSLLRSSPNNATRAPQAGSRGVLEFVSQRLWMERQRRILAAKCWKKGSESDMIVRCSLMLDVRKEEMQKLPTWDNNLAARDDECENYAGNTTFSTIWFGSRPTQGEKVFACCACQ